MGFYGLLAGVVGYEGSGWVFSGPLDLGGLGGYFGVGDNLGFWA